MFAWFTAQASASVTSVSSDTAKVGTAASTLSDVTYHIEVIHNDTSDALPAVHHTAPNGSEWAVVGGRLVPAQNSNVKFGSVSTESSNYSVKIYADNSGEKGSELSGADLTVALTNLYTTGKTYDIKATGTGRVRITTTNPTTTDYADNFTNAFSGGLGQTVTVGLLSFTSNPAANIAINSTLYYSVSGNAANTTPSVNDEFTAEGVNTDFGHITYSLAEHQNNG